jgi:hypothetical protein
MFAEMPLDNRTVNKFAALLAPGRHLQALSAPFGTVPRSIRLNVSPRPTVL